MAIPTYVAEGTVVAGVGAITPGLPAGISTDDILILWTESQAGQPTSISNANGGTWTKFVQVGSGTGAGGTALGAFWSRYNGTQGDPTVGDSGDHTFGYIEAYRGCVATGDPYEGLVQGNETTADTSVEVTGSTTLGADRLVLVGVSRENDDFNAHYSAWTNADLANIIERSDRGTVQGNGGGLATVTGEKATAGSYATTTAAVTNSVLDAFATFALIPASLASADAEVSWAEVEVPFANAAAEVSWSEVEVPFASANAELSWAEIEFPLAPAAAEVSVAEVEVPFVAANAEVSWAEVEVPFVSANAELSWAEVEVPFAQAQSEIGWAEVEVPLAPASAEVSWAEVEVPELGAVSDESMGRRSRRFRRRPLGG